MTSEKMREVYEEAKRRHFDDSVPCASGDRCLVTPPARVAYRGDVCAACRRVRERMARELRARKR